jgi:hypothetical protein
VAWNPSVGSKGSRGIIGYGSRGLDLTRLFFLKREARVLEF